MPGKLKGGTIQRRLIEIGLRDRFIQAIVGLVVIAIAGSFAISALGSGIKAVITIALSLSFGVILVILRVVLKNIDNLFFKWVCIASSTIIMGIFLVFAVFLIPAAFVCWPPGYVKILGLTSCPQIVPSQSVCLEPNKPIPLAACGDPNGQYVVANVHWDDPDTGLNVRQTAGTNGLIRGILPPNITELTVGNCESGWCAIECRNRHLSGWSAARYMKLRSEALQDIAGSNHSAVAMRNGPDQTCTITAWIPGGGRNLVMHSCQPSPTSGFSTSSNFCLVTYNNQTGWVDGVYLAPATQ